MMKRKVKPFSPSMPNIVVFSISGYARKDIGKKVFITSEGDVSTSGDNNSFIGYIINATAAGLTVAVNEREGYINWDSTCGIPVNILEWLSNPYRH